MTYVAPELLLIGQANSVVLGTKVLVPNPDIGSLSDPSLTSDTEW